MMIALRFKLPSFLELLSTDLKNSTQKCYRPLNIGSAAMTVVSSYTVSRRMSDIIPESPRLLTLSDQFRQHGVIKQINRHVANCKIDFRNSSQTFAYNLCYLLFSYLMHPCLQQNGRIIRNPRHAASQK